VAGGVFGRDDACFGSSELVVRRFVLVGGELHRFSLSRLTERGRYTCSLIKKRFQAGNEVLGGMGTATSFLCLRFDVGRHVHVVLDHISKELGHFVDLLVDFCQLDFLLFEHGKLGQKAARTVPVALLFLHDHL